jgi:hypothetical protein
LLPAMVLTLMLLPALYSWFERRKRLRANQPERQAFEGLSDNKAIERIPDGKAIEIRPEEASRTAAAKIEDG